MMASSGPATGPQKQLHVDADLRRRTEEFLATNPVLSKKLDDLDRLLMGHFLQTQLQDERNGWRSTLAKAIDEVERHRKLTLKEDAGGEEYQLRRQFTDFMDEEVDEDGTSEAAAAAAAEEAAAAELVAANDEAAERLQMQLSEARDEANAAAELAWHYENFIRELKAINTKLEARLTQLMQERRRCLKLLLPLPGGPEGVDLYKAIRHLQNRQEQKIHEQEDPMLLASDVRNGTAAASDQHHSEGQSQQPQAAVGTVVSIKQRGGGRVFSRPPPPADIAIVPLRPPAKSQLPQEQQLPLDPEAQARLLEAHAESGRLRKELHALAKALRAAEGDAREKAERLAAYEKQVASMKHAFTYRQQQQQQQQQQQPAVTAESASGLAELSLLAAKNMHNNSSSSSSSLPMLNVRHTHKRPSQQKQQQQQPLSDRTAAAGQHQAVMPAKTSVTRCLRCQKLYRLVDNNKFACKYHAKGRQRREQHNSQGKLADVLFVWDCCGRLANAEGCCYSEHI